MIKKNICILIFLLFPLPSFLCGNDVNHPLENEKEHPAQETVRIPDPLELKSSWWDYFQVSSEILPERIKEMQLSLNNLKVSLTADDHQSLLQLIDRISFNLDILLKKKQLSLGFTPTTVQFLKQYSTDQLLKVNKNYLQVQAKRATQEERLKSQKNHFSKIQSTMDELILQYQNQAKSSYNKLRTGLKLIDIRVELAVTDTEISLSQKRIVFYQNEERKLEDELRLAQEKLAFDFLSNEIAKDQWSLAESQYEKSKTDLHTLKKSAFYEEQKDPQNDLNCCLWSQKITSKTIHTEIAKYSMLMEMIKHILAQIANGTDQHSTSYLRGLESQWKKQIIETQGHISQWESQILDEQMRIGHEMTRLLRGEDKKKPQLGGDVIADIHFEFDQSLSSLQRLKMQLKNVELLYKQIDVYLLKEKSFWDTWAIRMTSYFNTAVDFVVHMINIPLFRIQNNPVTLSRLLQAILIIFGSLLISRFIRKTIFQETPLSRAISKSTEYVVSRCLHYGFIVIGIFAALAFIGLDFTNFVIVAGALGVGVGFGLQSLVNDIISGFLLLFQQNVKVGDIIELGQGLHGRVMAINLQNTHIKSFEGVDLIVPNAQLTSQLLNNWTLNDSCKRYRIPFKVVFGTDKELIRRIVLQAASKLPCTKKGDFRYPDPQVWMVGFGENSIDFELVVWVDLAISLPHGTPVATYFWEIETALKENGILIPIPKHEVYIR